MTDLSRQASLCLARPCRGGLRPCRDFLEARLRRFEAAQTHLSVARPQVAHRRHHPHCVKVLFCGTLFAPTQDRGAPGSGFTHHVGDVVRIRSGKLGELVNRVERSETLAPWSYGVRKLMRDLSRRGVPS